MTGLLWAALALALQLRGAHGDGRRHYGRPQGRARSGLIYFFTSAMLPQHKESVRNHPFKFAVGMVMHLGVLAALAGVIWMVIQPAGGIVALVRVRPLLLLALAAAGYLFVRRCLSRDLRAMSTPDDFLAALSTFGLLAVTALIDVGPLMPVAALVYAAVLFVYVPLGKLRHAVFFFAARAEYGRRLGLRGVYPPAVSGAK